MSQSEIVLLRSAGPRGDAHYFCYVCTYSVQHWGIPGIRMYTVHWITNSILCLLGLVRTNNISVNDPFRLGTIVSYLQRAGYLNAKNSVPRYLDNKQHIRVYSMYLGHDAQTTSHKRPRPPRTMVPTINPKKCVYTRVCELWNAHPPIRSIPPFRPNQPINRTFTSHSVTKHSIQVQVTP